MQLARGVSCFSMCSGLRNPPLCGPACMTGNPLLRSAIENGSRSLPESSGTALGSYAAIDLGSCVRVRSALPFHTETWEVPR